MKKIFTIAIVTLLLSACAETTSNKETNTNETDVKSEETNVPTEAQRREKEIRDSTKMLDKQLADPDSKSTPDSL